MTAPLLERSGCANAAMGIVKAASTINSGRIAALLCAS
jgi:hypothetical protein